MHGQQNVKNVKTKIVFDCVNGDAPKGLCNVSTSCEPEQAGISVTGNLYSLLYGILLAQRPMLQHRCATPNVMITVWVNYRGADKSLARLGRKQAELVESVMGRGMDWFDWGRDRLWTLVNVVMNLQVP